MITKRVFYETPFKNIVDWPSDYIEFVSIARQPSVVRLIIKYSLVKCLRKIQCEETRRVAPW